MELSTTQYSSLAQLALTHPAAARVFHRLRLDFCCGGRRSLADACRERGLDPEAVLSSIAAESASATSVRWDLEPLGALVQHIVANYHDPLREELPRLVGLARKVEARHAQHPACPVGLTAQLEDLQAALIDHLDKEEGILFPMIARGEGERGQRPVRVLEEEHSHHATHLAGLRTLTRNFSAPPDACTSWQALYLALEALERALMDHMHLENNVLFPRSLTEPDGADRHLAIPSRRGVWTVAVLALCLAGRAEAQVPGAFAPAGWDADVRLKEAADRNPDPGIVEIDIPARLADVEVSPGKRVKAWTYDGGLPGPLIRTRLGDRVIVHFRNDLPQPTTIHWHGVRVPIEMDGVPGISQDEVETGGSFTYDFVVRDAGLYWYHPHVMSAAQVGFGLYGALLVEDAADGVGVEDVITIVLSDIGFDRSGTLEPAESGGSAGMVFGREGAYVLVNGKTRPVLRARAGAPQRWRIVNAAKSRFFYLDLDGQTFVKIGGDGGLQERPVTTETVLVTAGERVDLIVSPSGKPGSELVLRSLLYNRGYGSVEYRSVEELMTIRFTEDAPVANVPLAAVSRTIVPPSREGATDVAVELTLPPVDVKGHSEFRVNGVPHWKAVPFKANLGETQIWTIKNDTVWDHPFHLHGYFFVVLDDKGDPVRPLELKDTLNIPKKTTARFIVSFDERPGTWMFHCHILDHADGGLMGTVQVGPVATEHTHRKPGP